MRIGIRANDFDGRGCGKTARDYAFSLVNRGHEVFFLASSKTPNIRANALSPHGKIIYNDFVTEVDKPEIITKALEGLIDTHQIDFLQMVKYGYDDGVLPKNCRTGVHCVFEMNQPHGTVYTAVSENLARQYGCAHYVPHIVRRIEPSENWRRKLGIPADAVVFGRHGGADQFNLRFVHSVISDILQSNRKDIYFLFLCTDKFCNDHKRLIRIPWVESDQDVANFIHACDCMIHARHMGETFGLAVGEFSACNKPVMTWSGVGAIGASSYDTAHLDHLGERALIYSDKASLQKLILDFDRNEMRKKSWDCFSVPFGEERVMAQYQEVFLESKEPSRAIQPEIVPEIHAETQKASARLDYNEVFERHGTDKGPLCHNYGRIYEHLFGQFSDRPFTLLEIGVYRGNSIKAWREIFPLAKIVGVDLSDAHVNEFESNVTIEVGDQGDPVFLESLKKKYRQFEVVIDDGSHKPRDQQIALNSLWSILTTGGVYVIEDLQVAYNDPWQSEGYVPTLDYLKSIVTRAGIKEGLETPWIVFAGELAAIIKPNYAGRPKAVELTQKPAPAKVSMRPTVHAEQWKKWLGHLVGKQGVIGLEIGTFQGESAEWMLDNIFTGIDSMYYCIDHFRGSVEHHKDNIDTSSLEEDTRARLARFVERTRIIKGGSSDVLPELWKHACIHPFDFCYIDGSHAAKDVLHDAVKCFGMLAVDGVMIFDDYEWTDMPRELDRPKLAIDAFLANFADQIEVLEPRGWQIAIRKTK